MSIIDIEKKVKEINHEKDKYNVDSIVENALLYDFYGELLTDRQKKIFELYHLDDLSLGEISEQMSISRQGVHDTIKRCNKQLHYYEEKLQLVAKFLINRTRTSEIYQLAVDGKNNDKDGLINNISKIEKISKLILEDL